MQSVSNANLSTFSWGSSGNVSTYGMDATYDGNGNILELHRSGIPAGETTSSPINDLTYHYLRSTNQLIGTTEQVVGGETCEVLIS